MQQYSDVALDRAGNVRAGVSIQINNADGSLATIYSDDGITPASNPLATSPNGQFSFYAADGTYKVMVNGSLWQTVQLNDLAASGGSAGVGFIQAGAGAVARTVQDKARESVTPLDYASAAQKEDVISGALLLDHTSAVQAAINTGRPVDLVGYSYKVNNLTQSTNYQTIGSSVGIGRLVKNANGPILTSTAADFCMENVNWRGDGAAPVYTGDGVVSSGARPSFINCGGRWISGRPLKATGSRVRVKGTCDIYQTTDATATGYDIEIGVSGTSTLYHELDEIYTSQSAGGILLTDTGSHTIKGGQFGKLTIAAGTKPSGVNGGKTIGARILGNVTVEQSSATFSSNHFDAVAVSFAAGTSLCSLDESNVFAVGSTVTNSGNANNHIARNVSTGSGFKTRWGADTSYREITLNHTDATFGWQFDGSMMIPNSQAYRSYLNAGTAINIASISSGDVLTLGGVSYLRVDVSGPSINLNTTGGSQAQVVDGVFRPFSDNTKLLGTASLRWNTVYAGTGTINTSDAREKQQVRELSQAERAVAVRCKAMLRAFKFNDAVQIKDDGARIHFGVMAQDVRDAFAAEGLDATRYALFCHDQWPEQPEIVSEDGEVIQGYRPAGDRYGVRYEELLAFIISAL